MSAQWTEERDELLKSLRAQGMPFEKIALVFGVHSGTVRYRAEHLGIYAAERRGRRRYLTDEEWTIPETALLMKLIEGGASPGQAGVELGITIESTKRRLRVINQKALEASEFFKKLSAPPPAPPRSRYTGPAKITLPRIEALERRPAWYFGETRP
jgi:hypothetical protein